ncbi:MAG: hypothetical protein ACN4GW_16515, partial [Desulforhopalus sp.]
MDRHFLVTISNDVHNLFGVQFVCSFFKKTSQHQITLLHISRLDGTEVEKSLSEMWAHPDDRVRGHLTVGAKRSIDKATTLLNESRMSIEQMVTKTVAERYGKVKDILTEGSTGLYDAIVLGRRAAYTLQWIFERPAEEMPLAMIKDTSFNTPLWICPEPGPGRKNVLVCVDGSENSFRAVDHTGFILSRQDQHSIYLFHVESGIGVDPDEVFGKARAILQDHQIKNERIKTKFTWGFSVPGSIITEINRGGYGAV